MTDPIARPITPFERALIPRSPTIHVSKEEEELDLLEIVSRKYEEAKKKEAKAREAAKKEMQNKLFRHVVDPRLKLKTEQ